MQTFLTRAPDELRRSNLYETPDTAVKTTWMLSRFAKVEVITGAARVGVGVGCGDGAGVRFGDDAGDGAGGRVIVGVVAHVVSALRQRWPSTASRPRLWAWRWPW